QQQPQPYNPFTRPDDWEQPPLARRSQNVGRVRTAIGIDSRYYYGGGTPLFYSPADFGEARMAALGWRYEAARAKGEGDVSVKRLRSTAGIRTAPANALVPIPADPRHLWDWYYFQTLRGESRDLLATALALSKASADPTGLLAFLNVLGPNRG